MPSRVGPPQVFMHGSAFNINRPQSEETPPPTPTSTWRQLRPSGRAMYNDTQSKL
jgi:hypothetical protein